MIKRETEHGTVFLADDLHPEDGAMLQALYSRSAESVEKHHEKVRETGGGRFMERFYVGYGHKSIGDCGSTTLFFENVSILAAKAIQDSPLYNGQETSTRYLDFSNRRIVDPVGTAESRAILDRWMAFYRSAADPTAAEVRRRHPRCPDEDEKAYEGAVKARVFDVLRGFLPAGMTTQLSLHTNLRQAADALDRWERHPLREVNRIGRETRALLRQRYPTSFGENAALSGVRAGDEKAHAVRVAWEETASEALSCDGLWFRWDGGDFESTIDNRDLDQIEYFLRTRPRGCVLPHVLSALGQVTFRFLLDYGAWRDIQRQRNGVCEVPTLTAAYDFEPWYLEQLDDETRAKAGALLEGQIEAISALGCSDVDAQYYLPLGMRVPTTLCYSLPAAVYVMELRSGKAVHPTLRRQIHQMIERFEREHPLVRLHVDREPDGWTVRRGTQTIVEKNP
jgi:thymidylate synthase ThyX